MRKISYKYVSRTKEEKFGEKIYFLLVENFPKTFLVGGAVRNKLLGFNSTDVDIATEAVPTHVIKLLQNASIELDKSKKNFGVITALKDKIKVEVTTLRKETYGKNRFPKVSFTSNVQVDSNRRDFTINSLYLSLKDSIIFDFNSGIKDINNRTLRFIGDSNKKVSEDPLRIVRAVRFMLQYKLQIERKDFIVLKKNFTLTEKISDTKKISEIKKVSNKKIFSKLKKIFFVNKNLDTLL